MDPTFEQQSILTVVVGFGALVMIVSGITAIIKNIALTKAAKNPARVPPIGEEAAKTYATKDDLASVKCEFAERCRQNHERTDKTFGEIFGVLRAQQESIINKLADVASWQRGIERQIGTLEGKIDP